MSYICKNIHYWTLCKTHEHACLPLLDGPRQSLNYKTLSVPNGGPFLWLANGGAFKEIRVIKNKGYAVSTNHK